MSWKACCQLKTALPTVYDLVQVPVEIEVADLLYFKHLVEQILEDSTGGG